MLVALTREVSRSIGDCEVTFIERMPIDVALARRQHEAYCVALGRHGLAVIRLPARDDQPDAVFIEDPLLVLDEVAIVLSPGAASRRAELDSLVPVIEQFRPVERITLPATIDGGDVLRIGRRLFVGESTRTNTHGVRALDELASPHGYGVIPIRVRGCLHLKSGCTCVGDRVLINADWVDSEPFRDFAPIPVAEPWAADVLQLPDSILIPSSFPETAARLAGLGYAVDAIDVSELQKAEAGVTCMSVIFEAPALPPDLQRLVI